MARYNNHSFGSSSSVSRTPGSSTVNTGASPDSYPSDFFDELGNAGHGISQPLSLSDMLLKIRSTQIYQTVYQVFSSASNSTYWLGQLQSILDSIAMPDTTFLDRYNLSQGYDDKVQAIYNDAISSISRLYSQYQEHVNSLPSTAVQQDAIAGINSAITGNIHGSTLSTDALSQGSAYGMQSTNGLEGISNIASFALDSVTGLCSVMSSFADVALKFKDLDLRKSQFSFDKAKSFADFKKLMSDSGVILKSSSWDDLDSLDPTWNDNASSRAKALHNAYTEVMTGISEGPAVTGAIRDRGYSPDGLSVFDNSSGVSGYQLGSSSYGFFLEREYGDVGKMQLDLAIARARRDAEIGNFQLEEGLTEGDVETATRRRDMADSKYNARKAVIFLERLEQLYQRSQSGDPVASVELINMMQNADWQESLAYMLGEKGYDLFSGLGGDGFFSDIIGYFRKKSE